MCCAFSVFRINGKKNSLRYQYILYHIFFCQQTIGMFFLFLNFWLLAFFDVFIQLIDFRMHFLKKDRLRLFFLQSKDNMLVHVAFQPPPGNFLPPPPAPHSLPWLIIFLEFYHPPRLLQPPLLFRT